ncbi:hypothetical protein DL766_008443 [Monosporascus sp. MC13-8B]|uniref:Saposin B-type domain-containing protein n=1 Tax=Monosporascus cannonballus TaxID=155416 RepID=A0ABY0H9I3_9PEZI|nr:hypothetical protein DL762_003785 [Monosporascus cannonballus]RYO93545.1 hypothetical protein DL763_004341 [Monosporascus cannonballus]RYP19433.1 hypothetical protein DL766_008443 [Monosporascus sp. MC13-8B]
MNLLLFPLMLTVIHAGALSHVPAPHRETTRDLTMGSSGGLLDQFHESDLDFHRWVGRMVEEGHLYYPNITDDTLMFSRSDSWYVKLKHVGCSTISGNPDFIAKTQTHFCSFVQKAEQIKALEMETEVMTLLCDDHRFCKLAVRAAFDFFNVFKDVDDVTKLCHEMFDALNQACPNGGGVADTEVGDNSGGNPYNGQLESSFSLDNGETCQQSATHECFDGSVPSS